ncbi:4-hydroxybenzoate polyprenyl transferase [Wolfiporia cocos MD-104 SS10]|uniref:4-hydroxybenzoate polyprenyltransferase, mitochondrial n=1 Tax=Wolfiporia cocos (strain MD-104) TaxID=742152 RepID=A0A2H3JDJ2_WOLCO|nr:4-hydroxybenzoate polyprenyl transferase [Wolfiporia cocos MD-104 SS10]
MKQPWWLGYWQLARMHKFPAGSILVFWPFTWGYVLGAHEKRPEPLQLVYIMAAFLIGSTLLHCAACTINDICDVNFDRQVERCKTRPLVAGTVSMPGAWIFFFLQIAVLFGMLSFVNKNAFLAGTFGIFPLTTVYPLMKRITWWPQAWLGLAMNWGLPTAWLIAAPQDVKSVPMWTLTFGTLCWTIVYDTIYACQDRKDDVKAGVKSTAVLFGNYVKPILSLFAAAFVAALAYAGYETHQGWIYYAVSVGGCAAHLLWQLVTVDLDVPEQCWQKFQSNGNLGYIVLGGMLGEWYLY